MHAVFREERLSLLLQLLVDEPVAIRRLLRNSGRHFTEAHDETSRLDLFRNARSDGQTLCDGNYLTGGTGDNSGYIYWTSNVSFSFMKYYKAYGDTAEEVALPGAEFALYTNESCTTALTLNGTAVKATSSSGTDDAGKVLFENLPLGVYYMKETDVPTVDASNNAIYIARENITYRIRLTLNSTQDGSTGPWNT